MRSFRRLLATVLFAALAALALVPLAASPASAAGDERIRSYDSSMTVGKDDSMRVVETVQYDFGSSYDKHGFYRTLVTRMGYDKDYRRLYPVDDIKVSSPSGAPADLSTTYDANDVLIRIGDPDRTVSGVQTYRISYRVKGVLNGFSDHDELYWNVFGSAGSGFDVPIDKATATVHLPGEVTKVRCSAGAVGTKTDCADASNSGDSATFQATSLQPMAAFTVVAAIPGGAGTMTKPILERIPSFATDFGPGLANIIGAVAVLAVGAVLFLLLRRRQKRAKQLDAAAPGPAPGRPHQSALRTNPDGSVEFVPPGNLRPGEVGTLVDESADTIDVTATIVDLAVRRYLVIDELPDKDWGLRMLKPPGPEFLPYEQKFFDQIFLGRPDRVRLSDLKNTFYSTLSAIKNMMYEDMRRRGWFASRRPRLSRWAWRILGIVVGMAGFVNLLIIADGVHGWFGIGWTLIMLLGVGIIVGAGKIPGRTSVGLAALADVHAFREEMARLDFAALPEQSRDEIMSRYLPYAMAFGRTNQWTAAFGRLEALSQRDNRYRNYRYRPYWYYGYGYGSTFHDWDANRFGQSLNSFSSSTSSAMASTPSSSGGSGFSGGGGGFSSGGGGGGGGGGSW
ncbi:MAG: DUF2207 domain-containing protein [Streptosporangiales bacterium]|nr:DUF2207 domain-containing protein [Streptosporangiales bacterium]MBO0891938.1 DUF2207 domain-containing protein [Acidothermales bacterium]